MTNLFRLICAAVILWQVVTTLPVIPPGPNPPGPVNPDWPTPSAELQAAIAPVRAVMHQQSTDRAKAAVWADDWESYLTSMMDRVALDTTGAFRHDMEFAMNNAAVDHLLVGEFVGFSAAMDQAFEEYFGSDDEPLDWNAAKEFVSAVVWACK